MNRNRLVRCALERNATHLLFIDNDMVFQPSAIQRLIDADKDIIGINYNARGVPGKPVVSTIKLVDPATDPQKNKTVISEFSAQLFPLFAVGTGFLLIKTDVFRAMDAPWFVDGEDKNGECFTEDVEFCRKAHKASFDVWCNPTIPIKHIGTAEY
jgi:GT2 family glycosyltransferase